jgi:hypothetical protein
MEEKKREINRERERSYGEKTGSQKDSGTKLPLFITTCIGYTRTTLIPSEGTAHIT